MPGANRLDQLIEQWEPRLRQAFMASIYAIRDGAQIGLIAEMLERGDFEGALRAVGIEPAQFRALDATVAEAFESGGRFTADRIPTLRQPSGQRLSIIFDVRNIRAEGWLREHSSSLIRGVVDDQRTMIRNTLRAGMEAGRNPRSVALDLVGRINSATRRREGGAIGLTDSQEGWARRYASELANGDAGALTRNLRDKRFDPTVAKAIRDKTPIPADIRDSMVRAYRNRALRFRAESIARTEALTALHQSQDEAMRQALEKGQVDQQAVTKVWHSARDNRVRETHREMDGQEVGFYASFVSPSGARLRFPGDPDAPAAEVINCRCWSETKIDFLRGIR